MFILTFEDNDVKYPITLYGKLNYLKDLMKKNRRRLIESSLEGNWVAKNQNLFVQFIKNMLVDKDWDDEFIYNYIRGKSKSVASLLGITSLYNKGDSFSEIVFNEKDHHHLVVIPFGDPEFDMEYYFKTKKYNKIVALITK